MLNITYYKLRAGKHLGYYIISLGNKGYGVGGAEEMLNQTLMIPLEALVEHGQQLKKKRATKTHSKQIIGDGQMA